MRDPYQILFVCSGNSCRSPMAEGILKAKLPEEIRSKVRVVSAGTLMIEGNPATDEAIKVSGEQGVDISAHRSCGISKELVNESNLILAMSDEHVRYLHKHFPESKENVFLLKKFDNASLPAHFASIPDPIGMPISTYRACLHTISSEIDRILPRIEKLVKDYYQTG